MRSGCCAVVSTTTICGKIFQPHVAEPAHGTNVRTVTYQSGTRMDRDVGWRFSPKKLIRRGNHSIECGRGLHYEGRAIEPATANWAEAR
jgi:hypothetical protein